MSLRQKRGFSLVELLVVLAIVVVLAGIVYASTGGVREKARQTVCLSNLHSIGQALFLYRQDYDGRDGPGSATQMGLPPGPLALGLPPRRGGRPYVLGGDSAFHCPNVPQDELRRMQHRDGRWCAYGYQVWGTGAAKPAQFPEFSDPVRRRGHAYPIMFDFYHHFPPVDRPSHTQFVLVLRLDGSVQGRHHDKRKPSWEW